MLQCLRLNIPEDDDAHMVFLSLPSESFENDDQTGSPDWTKNYSGIENHFLNQMQDLTNRRTKNGSLLRKFPEKPPQDVQNSMNSFISSNESKSGCTVKLTNPKSTSSRSFNTHWFIPLVINHLRKAVRTEKKDRESSPLEGYEACFQNENDYPVHFILDSVMVGEGPEYDDDDNASEDPTFQGHHLTPLANLLEESIKSAKVVITEMQYMERREARMRHTADNINSRVRFFSYISIAILFVVTFLQVSYLKRYFKKKKLL